MTTAIFIDDEKDILEYYEFCLNDIEGVDIHTFNTHTDASDFIRENAVQKVFIDWRMPEGTALDFLSTHNDTLKTCDKIIVTGELELEESILGAVDTVIYKPFKTDDIKALLV